MTHALTLGSLFSGIGGFDLGFEQAGWTTKWVCEIDATNRAVLADRFPAARQFADICRVNTAELDHVDCIAFGSPCQGFSIMAQSKRGGPLGLADARSGLFFEAMRIVAALKPQWVVMENVPRILSIDNGAAIRTVIGAFRELGYLGHGRVLNARHFGVPQNRRRLFLVAGLGRFPPPEYLADSAPMDPIPVALDSIEERPGDSWASYTLLACNVSSRINMGSEILIAEKNGWNQMAERARKVEAHGLSCGLDESQRAEAYAAGNAVCPQIARWIGSILTRA